MKTKLKDVQFWIRKNSDSIKLSLLFVILALVFLTLSLQISQVRKIGKTNTEKLDNITKTIYPISFDSPQDVLREPPQFHLDEPVRVKAKFNNNIEQTVTVTAVVNWELVSPMLEDRHVNVVQFGLFLKLEPGCTEQTFINKPEFDVIAITKELFNNGADKVTWRLHGYNQVILPENGGSQQFSVEEFTYIPDNIALPEYQDNDITGCN